ncbi:phosphoglycerate kinase [Parvibaculum sp.]|uniref:phosphoglycerate kinase n=1 Tax=Parvibaculum sp. TaxID=2024848 RepID=UPI000C539A7D|nr:phosphoglycerate kinase [Parvibaculum sp.]HAC59980.1 phosphoglycerate kinase [Rhodobiaceae bacterium]MAU59625.1 phosphoglycerate kinase [Parvibaculum sp.]MBO6667848.1 phosphoglycerate kinase [Parvibaculum sp.]MBO6690711.1 phosphoglycerate kinase [Parvibaculum sp.]MBO6714916.1 phosphoglycerate kinase [Parvibaculum sp.]|tara:strand:- start:2380 stop:3588 length:1209 start_codon:yes stop_codon:yes gene_type:complete
MADHKTLDDLAAAVGLKGLRVLVRADLNVPMQDGKVSDATRIERVAPTLKELASQGARVIVLSHFGRPKGKPETKYSLKPVADALAAFVGVEVGFAEDCIGEKAAKACDSMKPGTVLILENTRFHEGEENNDPDFAKALAENGNVYVNDAFSCAHRAHASTEGITYFLPSYAGRAMEAELSALDAALGNPKRPVVAIVGGAKISTKIALLGNLVKKVDALVIGGGMANTFLAAQGKKVGKSLCEPDLFDTARHIMANARAAKCDIVLPSDVVVAKELKAGTETHITSVDDVPEDQMILDVGPDTLAHLAGRFETANTVVWNGPLGAFEVPPFDKGTTEAARIVAMRSKQGELVSVAGGGDTVAALNEAGAADDFTYVSAAGGAFLEWMEGVELPGVAALSRK